MRKILLIKVGALGDVVRTTPLLRRLRGEVSWVTGTPALPLLAGNPLISRALPIERAAAIAREKFDWVINLDEERQACALAAKIKARRKTGALLAGGGFSYCAASAPWFDMSLISRFGREAADKLKYANRRTYQSFLFEACGFKFTGEEYMLPPAPPAPAGRLVAIEQRTGARWPLKRWPGCRELAGLLERRGIPFFFLRSRPELAGYLRDINRCSVLVSGDTLAMHAALGLGKRAVAVFNCTSPREICGYGRLRKLVHPGLRALFYSRRRPGPDFPHIPAKTVLKEVLSALRPPLENGGFVC
jgi:heptosyltransferase-2